MHRASYTKAHVRLATLGDSSELAGRLRERDLEEIAAYTGRPAETELRYPIEVAAHQTYSILSGDEQVVGMFGVAPSRVPRIGRPWLMGSEELFDNHTRQFLRECKDWVRVLQKDFPILENFVLASNERHLKWINWAGFELVEYLPKYGIQGRPFWRFRRVAP